MAARLFDRIFLSMSLSLQPSPFVALAYEDKPGCLVAVYLSLLILLFIVVLIPAEQI
jgi:hypothetical protein